MTAVDRALDLVRRMRGALKTAGLARKEFDGSVYWVGGKGEKTLVLLHGTNDQAGTWSRVVPLLIDRCRLILPDLAGHGESEPRSGPIPVSLVARQVRRVLDREKARDIILAGSSFGAWMAVLYALEHGDRVERLVLESGGGLALPLGVPLIALDRATAATILRAVHGPNFVPPEWVVEALLARAVDSPMLRLTDMTPHFVDARLAQLNVPTTLVWGADDGVVPLSYAEALRKGIEGARLDVIEGAAHIPHQQQPERFVECLLATS